MQYVGQHTVKATVCLLVLVCLWGEVEGMQQPRNREAAVLMLVWGLWPWGRELLATWCVCVCVCVCVE